MAAEQARAAGSEAAVEERLRVYASLVAAVERARRARAQQGPRGHGLDMLLLDDQQVPATIEIRDLDPILQRGCPPDGDAATVPFETLNRLEIRMEPVDPSVIDPAVPMDALRPASDDDLSHWFTGLGAPLVGLAREARSTPAGLTDTHHETSSDASGDGLPLIAEITLSWRPMHVNDGLADGSSSSIKARFEGEKMRITGRLLFDPAHLDEATYDDPDGSWGRANGCAPRGKAHPARSLDLSPTP